MAVETDRHISAVVTDLRGNYLAELAGEAFRSFVCSWEWGDTGSGSLEYRLSDNPLLDRLQDLFDPTLESTTGPNLVWMTFRGKTCVWIVEDLHAVEDDTEEGAGSWMSVSGSGVRALLGDRLVEPANFAAGQDDQSVWASSGEPHSGPDGQWLEYAAADTWHAGDAIMDMIERSNERFATQIVAGTIETDTEGDSDLLAALYRFDNLGEVVTDLERRGYGHAAIRGEIDPDAGFRLVFDWFLPIVATGTPAIVFDEGVDLAALEYGASSRDARSHICVEGGILDSDWPPFSFGPEWPPFDMVLPSVARRRELYTRAGDLNSAARYDFLVRELLAAITSVSVSFAFTETAKRAVTDFTIGQVVGVRAPRRGVPLLTLEITSLMISNATSPLSVGITVGAPLTSGTLRAAQLARSGQGAVDSINRRPLVV